MRKIKKYPARRLTLPSETLRILTVTQLREPWGGETPYHPGATISDCPTEADQGCNSHPCVYRK